MSLEPAAASFDEYQDDEEYLNPHQKKFIFYVKVSHKSDLRECEEYIRFTLGLQYPSEYYYSNSGYYFRDAEPASRFALQFGKTFKVGQNIVE